jgi:hypothetical protein
MTLADFAGALFRLAEEFKHIRFHIFSDCAFLATSIEYAADLLSAVRYSFTQWISDSILVRGGLAIGSYKENRSGVQDFAPKNFSWSFFAGSGVVEAVRLEGAGRERFFIRQINVQRTSKKRSVNQYSIWKTRKLLDGPKIFAIYTGILVIRCYNY